MPPWLHNVLPNAAEESPLVLLARIGIAFLLGCLVAMIYRATHRSGPIAPTFPRTLVLLAILISMVAQVIGDNVARAFSLVGALSIVRFRTVVRDTQDTAFVIFAVIVGMAAGADHLWVALSGLIVVAIAIVVLRPRGTASIWSDEDCDLSLRVAIGSKPEVLLENVFGKFLKSSEVLAVTTAKQGGALDLAYKVRLRSGCAPADLVKELNQLEGVQSVELRRPGVED
jgi:uncharacterized membrane protein YhiD involved in acid resistance